ncbi:MAG: tRNA threonylcarbamoyladenosine dehydratase [Desulfotomaculaceae bacterium]|nr:tRNA threonylcarbamoyladenosine dehydratase [Desulfotomaculaceae bacterium]
MLNKFSRTELLIGKKALEKLSRSKVAIFGIGGVGTYAVEGLVRAGVGKFVLVDDDCICLTNINRQLHATIKTIGKPKVEVMKDRILDINPGAEVTAIQVFYTPECALELVKREYDYIIDSIDTVTGKIDLILNAQQQGIPIISCMGAGNKLDPTKFQITDIYKTSVCPLARVMRKELRKRGVTSLKVVFSKEEPLKPQENDGSGCRYNRTCLGSTKETCTVRRQVPGSISFVPSVAGLIMAGEVVKDLINK